MNNTAATKPSRWKARRVQCYPPPYYKALVEATAKYEGISVSDVVSEAIKKHFDGMPEKVKAHIKSVSKHMY